MFIYFKIDISIINYLKLGWNLENLPKLAKYSDEEREYFYIYLNTYEGTQHKCKVA